ncbi:MAG: F0F1 ATP synthase subunit B [Gammaproteobacteria bacterium]|nr:F0F1 ATP synthase subunit B [Gammaproteobacteria bacterium]
MAIDWFTFGAQIVNFVVLVWLLERLLYRPVLRAMDARQARIEQARRAASEALAAAENERKALEKARSELAAHNAALRSAAESEAAHAREEALAAARAEVAAARARWRAALAEEQGAFETGLRRAVETEVLALARQVLAELADSSLEARIAAAFAARLRALAGAERAALLAAFGSGSGRTVCVRSAWPLDAAARGELEAAVREVLGAAVCPRFEERAALVCGIELAVDGHKLAWSVDEYLHGLGERLATAPEAAMGGG